jgi:hypothetical protein
MRRQEQTLLGQQLFDRLCDLFDSIQLEARNIRARYIDAHTMVIHSDERRPVQ